MSTIFAVSSGMPPAAIAVLRISGPAAAPAVIALAGALPPARTARLRALRDPDDGTVIDRALVLHFPAPNTATGEDLVELHLHGGRAIVAAVERVLERQPGLRRAEPGEFTRRALRSGRLDLAEAEGLGDLLLAETEDQRRAAMSAVEGEVSRAISGWQVRLLDLAARMEALLDFSDEEDVDVHSFASLQADAVVLADDISDVLANPPVERLRDGIRLVLAGAPNVGKSTLLNALSQRDAAIVSPIAGTTRDRIEVPVMRNGIAYVLTDTAGLAEETSDSIERIGIDRTREAIAGADIVLLLDDTPAPPEVRSLRVHPRADMGSAVPNSVDIAVSALTGVGLAELWAAIAAEARQLLPRLDRLVLNKRQHELCAQAAASVSGAAENNDALIMAEQLRVARTVLDRITGTGGTEAMLDALFGRFCIGK